MVLRINLKKLNVANQGTEFLTGHMIDTLHKSPSSPLSNKIGKSEAIFSRNNQISFMGKNQTGEKVGPSKESFLDNSDYKSMGQKNIYSSGNKQQLTFEIP